jgi:hypothetical protein
MACRHTALPLRGIRMQRRQVSASVRDAYSGPAVAFRDRVDKNAARVVHEERRARRERAERLEKLAQKFAAYMNCSITVARRRVDAVAVEARPRTATGAELFVGRYG